MNYSPWDHIDLMELNSARRVFWNNRFKININIAIIMKFWEEIKITLITLIRTKFSRVSDRFRQYEYVWL